MCFQSLFHTLFKIYYFIVTPVSVCILPIGIVLDRAGQSSVNETEVFQN